MHVVNWQGDLVLNAASTWWAILGAGVEYSGDAGKQTCGGSGSIMVHWLKPAAAFQSIFEPTQKNMSNSARSKR
jgi:hypothetical protein